MNIEEAHHSKALLDDIHRQVKVIAEGHCELEKKASETNTRLTRLEHGFDQLEMRVVVLDKKVERLDARIDALDAKVAALDARLSGQISALDTRLSGQIGELGYQIGRIITHLGIDGASTPDTLPGTGAKRPKPS